jgi:hypothetical protein
MPNNLEVGQPVVLHKTPQGARRAPNNASPIWHASVNART